MFTKIKSLSFLWTYLCGKKNLLFLTFGTNYIFYFPRFFEKEQPCYTQRKRESTLMKRLDYLISFAVFILMAFWKLWKLGKEVDNNLEYNILIPFFIYREIRAHGLIWCNVT